MECLESMAAPFRVQINPPLKGITSGTQNAYGIEEPFF